MPRSRSNARDIINMSLALDRDLDDFRRESDDKIQDVLKQAKLKLGLTFVGDFRRESDDKIRWMGRRGT